MKCIIKSNRFVKILEDYFKKGINEPSFLIFNIVRLCVGVNISCPNKSNYWIWWFHFFLNLYKLKHHFNVIIIYG
jgi:hypothetical protein